MASLYECFEPHGIEATLRKRLLERVGKRQEESPLSTRRDVERDVVSSHLLQLKMEMNDIRRQIAPHTLKVIVAVAPVTAETNPEEPAVKPEVPADLPTKENTEATTIAPAPEKTATETIEAKRLTDDQIAGIAVRQQDTPQEVVADAVAATPDTTAKALKEQKKFLIEHIDEAIKSAPSEIDGLGAKITNINKIKEESAKIYAKASNAEVEARGPLLAQYEALNKRAENIQASIHSVTIEVPNDGNFTVYNNKETLKKFKEIVGKKFPTTVEKAKNVSVPSDRARGYRAPKELEDGIAIKIGGKPAYTDGSILLMGKSEAIPKTPAKRWAARKPTDESVKQIFESSAKYATESVDKIKFVAIDDNTNRTYTAADREPEKVPYGVSDTPIKGDAQSSTVLMSGEASAVINTDYYQHIVDQYPDATFKISKNVNKQGENVEPVGIYNKGKQIGVVMPWRSVEAIQIVREHLNEGPANGKTENVATPVQEEMAVASIANATSPGLAKFSLDDKKNSDIMGNKGEEHGSEQGGHGVHGQTGSALNAAQRIDEALRRSSNNAASATVFANESLEANDLAGIADAFGKKIVYVKVKGIGFNGATLPSDPGVIYINIATQERHLSVFGHELVHTIKADSPALYQKFYDLMLEQIKDDELFQAKLNITELRSGMNASDIASSREELIADFVGHRITRRDFMESLHKKAPTIFDKIASIIRSLIAKVSKIFKPETSKYIKDLQKAEDIATDILAEYAKSKAPASINEAVLENGGFRHPDIKFSLQRLEDIKDNVSDALPHLVDIGRSVYHGGARTYQSFVDGMRSGLGALWSKFKHLMLKVFSEARRTPAPAEVKGSNPETNAKESVPGDTTENPTQMQGNDQRIIENSRSEDIPEHVDNATKKLVEFASSNIPPKIKAEIGRFLSNPWFGSEGNEHRRSVVLKNVERSHNRNEIRAELYTRDFESNYLGIEGMKNALKELSAKDHEVVDHIIKQGDIEGKEYTAEELLSDHNPTGHPVSKNIINAYKAFRDVIEKAGEIRFARLRELAILSYKNETWYADLQKVATEKADDRSMLLSGMKDRQAIEKAFKSAMTYWTELERIKKEWHKVKGYAPRTREDGDFFVNAYRKYKEWDFTVRDIEDASGKTMGQEAIVDFNLDVDQVNEIKRIAQDHKATVEVAKSGFITITRMGGDVSAVLDDIKAEIQVTEENPLLRKVYMQTARSEAGAARHAEEVRQALPKHLKANFEKGAEYVVKSEPNTSTPEDLLNLSGTDMAKEAMITRAFEAAGEKGYLDDDQIEALKQGVLESLAREIMARGFARHGIARAAHLIEGYKDRKYIEVATDYASGLAGWLSKMQFAIESSNVMRQIPKEKPDDKVWVHNYVRDAMKNATYTDQMAATARSVAALYYLGFKFSTVLLNGFQNFTVAQAEFSRHTSSPLLKLMAAQRDVMEDYWKHKKTGEHTLSKEEVAVLSKASREGIDQAQAIEFMSGISETGASKGFHKLTRTGMSMFQWVETHVNREPAMLAAYRVFKKTEAGTFDQAAFDKAEEFVYNTHYLMGKENLPEMARSPIGKTLYVFQGYVHNYLHWMYNRARDGEFSVIARSLAAIVAIGGIGALPIAGDLDKWIEKWFGVSYQMKFKKFMRENTRGMGWYGDTLNDFVNYGAPSVFGVDMSRALAVNLPVVADPDKSMAERIGGAWGTILAKPGQAMKAMGAGDTYRAMESLMPEFIANPMRGYRQLTGATTVAGKPSYDSNGRQIRYSGTDMAKKAMGFQPLGISAQSQIRSSGIEIKSAWEDKRNNALARLRRAKTPEDIRAARQNIMQFNSKLRESQAFGLIDIISADTLRRSMSERHDVKQEKWSGNYLATASE